MAADVAGGATLADAFRKHPRVFGGLYTNMLQVGETAGALDTILRRLASYLEKAAALRRKVKAAMMYPLTIVGVAGLVVIFMMTFVIPTFAQMFKNFGAELPLPTRVVIALSEFVRAALVPAVAIGAAAAYAVRRAYRTPRGRFVIDRVLLKIPVLAPLIRKVAIARVTRTLGTLIACGVPILEGLRITAKTAGNQIIEDTVMMARAALAAGRNLTEPLRGLPGSRHGRADGQRGRTDGLDGGDADEDRRLLRRRGGRGRGEPHRAAGTRHDRVPGHRHRRPRDRHVPAHLQARHRR